MCLFAPQFWHHNKLKINHDHDLVPFRPVVPGGGRLIAITPSFFHHNQIIVAPHPKMNNSSSERCEPGYAQEIPYSDKDFVDIHVTPEGMFAVGPDGEFVGCKGVDERGLLIFKDDKKFQSTGVVREIKEKSRETRMLEEGERVDKLKNMKHRLAEARIGFQKSMDKLNEQLQFVKTEF